MALRPVALVVAFAPRWRGRVWWRTCRAMVVGNPRTAHFNPKFRSTSAIAGGRIARQRRPSGIEVMHVCISARAIGLSVYWVVTINWGSGCYFHTHDVLPISLARSYDPLTKRLYSLVNVARSVQSLGRFANVPFNVACESRRRSGAIYWNDVSASTSRKEE
ncbi:hypothetical protein BV25DRAFT_1838599 [Artomyces pyxidatus]|uniref:Uncharacterized protein n=1 Tax=Artomyces pyxidatus TaxID=48021 RepID=A0ACB8T128_9AGAM|nr:hypothetical protein BV25DRAFT_1838599 [Artomyces pyxidatus]